jgi:hypothetical protein
MPPVAFPFMANAADPILETLTFPTDVLPAYDSSEQRISLREVMVGSVEFTVLCPTPRESALLHSLLFKNQPAIWAVGLWTYAKALASGISIGATSVPYLATAEAPFYLSSLQTGTSSPYVMLWRSPFSFELFQITSLTTNAINCAALASAWAAGTYVLPVRLCNAPESIPFVRLGREIAGERLRWTFNEQAA